MYSTSTPSRFISATIVREPSTIGPVNAISERRRDNVTALLGEHREPFAVPVEHRVLCSTQSMQRDDQRVCTRFCVRCRHVEVIRHDLGGGLQQVMPLEI